ncbi:MAG: PBP1A family penicillin-binding protein [Gemmatimonadota bacterium]|nr:PBP1A family penicillin-binding protein [Gemmatimonadota bacterium]
MTNPPQINDPDNTATPLGAKFDAPVNNRRRWIPRIRFRSGQKWSLRKKLVVFAALLASIALPVSWWTTCAFDGCPSAAELRAWRPTEGGAVLDIRGQSLGPIVVVKRTNVPLSRVPLIVQNAFIAVEDRRFREHHGVDWRGVGRAALANVRALGVREGASTISMQLARNVFLVDRASERTFGRKFLEWRFAGLLENALTKDQILERYLNAIYLGNGVYGVEGASLDLFGKSVSDVTLAEAAMLAGLPKAPSAYSPRHDKARARSRRDVVLAVLDREHVASRGAIVAAHAFDVNVVADEWNPARNSDSWALEMVRNAVDSLRALHELPASIANANLVVHTTFDRKAQRAAERAVAHGASQVDAQRNGGGSNTQGAFVALDPQTGAIRAIVGGRQVERRGFNRALSARRQPGSAFKPFVYTAAIQKGYTTATIVEDEPISIEIGKDTWTPTNFDEEYGGRITLRQALTRSANAATVRVSRDIGIPRIAALATQLGIHSALPLVPALALGAGEVTPLELTAAYTAFGNGGRRVTPHVMLRIEDTFGRVQWSRREPSTTRVLDSSDAFLVTSMLRSVVDEGTGHAVRNAGIRGPVAGKTGTTNDGADVWFVGFTPTIVAAIWFGADVPQPLGSGATGGRLAAPAWSEFLQNGWHSPARDSAWPAPRTLLVRQIDVASGTLANDACGESRRDWFKPGTEPREQCSNNTIAFGNGRSLGDEIRNVISSVPDHEINSALDAVLQQLGQSHISRSIAQRVKESLKRAAAHERNSNQRRHAQQLQQQQQMQQQLRATQRQMQRDMQRAQQMEREQSRINRPHF